MNIAIWKGGNHHTWKSCPIYSSFVTSIY